MSTAFEKGEEIADLLITKIEALREEIKDLHQANERLNATISTLERLALQGGAGHDAIVKKAVQLQAELATHHWIPVSEGLPKDEIKVFVTNGKYAWTDRYLPCSKRWENLIEGGGRCVVYTHWKPATKP